MEDQEAGKKMKRGISFNTVAIFLICLAGAAIYLNSINNAFLWDDHFLIKDNLYIRHWSYVPRIFSADVGYGPRGKFLLYRPIQILSYMPDYLLWKLKPQGYHITNILLHVGVALVLYWFINLLWRDKALSFLAALFFVVHPVHTEVVTYISGRADSLAALFMLLAFIYYIKSEGPLRWPALFLAAVFYLLALLSRENSLIMPALIILYHLVFRKKMRWGHILIFAGIAIGYIIVRAFISKPLSDSACQLAAFYERVPGFFAALSRYIELMILPLGLHMEYGNVIFTMAEPSVIIGVILMMAGLLYCAAKIARPIVVFALSFFFIALVPASNIYPLNAYMAEHWLYFPSIGLFILFSYLLVELIRRKKTAGIIIALSFFVFYSLLTIRQNTCWSEPVSFYKRLLEYAPDSARIYNNLGTEYSVLGNREDAAASYKKAISLDPFYATAYNNLGVEFYGEGKIEMAIRLYKKAIALMPNYANAYNNIGIVYRNTGKAKDAIDSFKKSIESNPEYMSAYDNLSGIYLNIGDNEEAIRILNKAIEVDPRDVNFYNNLGVAYHNVGRDLEAAQSLNKALMLRPDSKESWNNLGNIFSIGGRREEAIACYKQAIAIDPKYAEAYNNLGSEYAIIGRNEEAIYMFKKAITIDPLHQAAQDNISMLYNHFQKQISAESKDKKK